MNNKILLLDPDPKLSKLLEQYLLAEQYEVSICPDGEQGLKKALNQHFDAIILELILPKLNGFEVIQGIREYSDSSIMVLSSRSDELDRFLSLKMGADEYLEKPCNPFELLLKLKNLIKRNAKKSIVKPQLQQGQISLDSAKRQVLLQGEPLELTNAEFNILEILMKSPGQAFSKEELTEYALGRKFTAFDRSIDVHISNLRNKLGHNETGEEWLKTVRGFGYAFNPGSNGLFSAS